MAKKTLSPQESFELTQALHVSVLDALMGSRRWEPKELVFQGGTSLHLAHGSPRFSEDLDFLVDSTLDLGSVSGSLQKRLEDVPWLPNGTQLEVGKAKEGKNPHTFNVSIRGDQLIGSVRVKVEMWGTSPEAMARMDVNMATVRLTTGPVSNLQAFVPTADLAEIYADKVFAVVARPAFKPRDVFDLHWLGNHTDKGVTKEQMAVRLATYPNTSEKEWLEKAMQRRRELPEADAKIAADLGRWLPSSWAMNEGVAKEMAKEAIVAIEQGIDVMRALRDENDKGLSR